MGVDIIRARQTVAYLTNRTGGTVTPGAVVLISGVNPQSFVATAVEGQSAEMIGVSLDTITNNDTGRILTHGYAPQINLDVAAVLGDWIETDGVALQGTPVAAPEEGVFAQVLEIGTTPAAIIGPHPQPAGGAGAGGLVKIDEDILGIAAVSIDFAAIPATSTHLLMVCSLRNSGANEIDGIYVRFNADAGNNYDHVQSWGRADNTKTSSGTRGTNIMRIGQAEGANSRANSFAPCIAWIPFYARTDREKYIQSQWGVMGNVSAQTDVYTGIATSRWRSTVAITSISVFPQTGPNWVAASGISLYGLT